MKLGYTIFYVAEVIETVAFYEKAFGLKNRFVHESGTYAEMETGQTALAFASEMIIEHPFRKSPPGEDAPGVEIALVTEDVQKGFEKAVNAGAIPLAKPMQKPWGQTVSYVRDNNGFIVEICSSIS